MARAESPDFSPRTSASSDPSSGLRARKTTGACDVRPFPMPPRSRNMSEGMANKDGRHVDDSKPGLGTCPRR